MTDEYFCPGLYDNKAKHQSNLLVLNNFGVAEQSLRPTRIITDCKGKFYRLSYVVPDNVF